MSNTRSEATAVIETLKGICRDRGIRYRDLAVALNVSLPTVKRLMGSSDLSFERICQICDRIDLSVFDLMQIAHKRAYTPLTFTAEQNAFLADHPECIPYFFALARDLLTPDEIERKYGLDPRTTNRYLKLLEEIDLIERLPEGRIRLKVRPADRSSWADDSPLGRVYMEHILKEMSVRALNGLGKNTQLFFDTGHQRLTPAEYRQFQQDWHALVATCIQKSRLNTASHNPEAVPVTYLLAADVWRDPFFTDIRQI